MANVKKTIDAATIKLIDEALHRQNLATKSTSPAAARNGNNLENEQRKP